MIQLLAKRFVPRWDQVNDPEVRRSYGVLCGLVGIGFNLLLFAGKFFAGLLSGSVAITADAFNNLSDAGSSVVTLLGFKLAAQKPDRDHPFGHGRMEYISGLVVAMLIVLMGVELLKSSGEKILHPEDTTFSLLAVGILVVSILVKLYMWSYNRRIGRKISSTAMEATAADSLSDAAATSVVLAATLVGHFTSWHIDGWCGLAVALFILRTGYGAAKDTISPLLGQPPAPELVEEIRDLVMAHPEVVGIHDLVVHDYGPGRVMISLHAEVSASGDLATIHDAIDNVERELSKRMNCEAVIHMDPIATDDQLVSRLREEVGELVRRVDPSITIHDFRMVAGPTHTNLIFDAVVPFGLAMSDKEVANAIHRLVEKMDGNYYAVVQVEKSYI